MALLRTATRLLQACRPRMLISGFRRLSTDKESDGSKRPDDTEALLAKEIEDAFKEIKIESKTVQRP
eukprot:377431-Amorphochlora_amoeboformis.AAC.1